MKMSSTAKEALLAELLGDVGKLEDLIKNLPDELKKSIEPTITIVNKINSEILANAKSVSSSQKIEIENFIHQQKLLIQSDLEDAVKKQIEMSLKNASVQLEHMYRSHALAINKISKQSWQFPTFIFMAFLSGLMLSFFLFH
jgi:hypothetical protein